MSRCVEYYDKWRRDPNWCHKCERSCQFIEGYINLLDDLETLGISQERTIVQMPEWIARPLISIQSEEIREKVLSSVSKWLESGSNPITGRFDKITKEGLEALVVKFGVGPENIVYTIGYEGRDLKEFIDILKGIEIKSLFDIRFSAESQYKPDFNKIVLSRELQREGIRYEHLPDLGVPYEWQNPYKEGAIPIECLTKYYRWHSGKISIFKGFVNDFATKGKSVLMCFEKYAVPFEDQKIHCHRDILATMLMETKLFSDRVDL